MSVTGKLWNLLSEDRSAPLLKRLLEVRGIVNEEDIEAFLHDTKTLHDPFGLKDMEKAVSRVKDAINTGQKIIIFGDYDVDGISGTSVLVHTLERIGANVSYRLPHRVNNGYGLTEEFIEEFQKIGVSLVITVDCGISCKPQIDLAKEYGIDVIITDHHLIPEAFPTSAYAILHPLQKDCDYIFPYLSGSGMAFKFACALLKGYLPEAEYEKEVDQLCDLACLGTVADLVPLKGENRVIVKRGLRGIHMGRWPGIAAIKEVANITTDAGEWDADVIGYGLGPRINAAGRISEAYFALQTLLGKKEFAMKLETLNNERKEMTYKALEELEEIIAGKDKGAKIIIENSKDWHTGIIGLLAGKMAEKHKKPVIIMEDRGHELVGSSRSPEFFSMVDALSDVSDLLVSFGGHTQAAGFTIKKENLADFKKRMRKLAEDGLNVTQLKNTLDIDTLVDMSELDWSSYDMIKSMAPFGVGNKKPKFLLKDIEVRNIYCIGADKRHLRFDAFQEGPLSSGGTESRGLQVIGFNMGEYEKDLYDGRKISLVAHLDKNTWNGDTFLQLRLVDFEI
ncbi:MAG: single-stranded-DNA-specific exonuclease RecJ [Candidatus Peregrinibacteria bacterium]|nr:single-stranded-DNA-specific exonuclease RecJ [Candidatus Peregrinibacteria bacterium]MDZ4244664.1 single-stranded-DNA-specific exonuclease RecJ [Candidatus Gracilibacteria bacterium]